MAGGLRLSGNLWIDVWLQSILSKLMFCFALGGLGGVLYWILYCFLNGLSRMPNDYWFPTLLCLGGGFWPRAEFQCWMHDSGCSDWRLRLKVNSASYFLYIAYRKILDISCLHVQVFNHWIELLQAFLWCLLFTCCTGSWMGTLTKVAGGATRRWMTRFRCLIAWIKKFQNWIESLNAGWHMQTNR